jgi:hypothetical protein
MKNNLFPRFLISISRAQLGNKWNIFDLKNKKDTKTTKLSKLLLMIFAYCSISY